MVQFMIQLLIVISMICGSSVFRPTLASAALLSKKQRKLLLSQRIVPSRRPSFA